jgi:hypothetical protein
MREPNALISTDALARELGWFPRAIDALAEGF